MSFKIDEIGPCKKRAEFQLSSKDVQEGFDEVYEEICETISFPGFRKGKVPRSLIAKKYSKDIVGEVKEKLINKSFYAMIDDEKLEIISQPSFDEKGKEFKEGDEFSYSVSFEVKPNFELPEYKGIELVKTIKEVDDEHIKQTQDNLLRSHSTLEEVEDGVIEAEDYPTLHLDVEDESGEVVHHNHSFICHVASGQVDLFKVDDIAKKLKGLKKGDSKSISFTVPDEFPAKEELAGKKVNLKIEVENVKRVQQPEFNDEFVKKLGFGNEEEYLETLKKMLGNEFEKNAKEDLKNQIYDFLDKSVTIDLPEDTVKAHSDYLVQSKIMQLVQTGVPYEEANSQKETLEKEAIEEAGREVKIGFTLGKIADKEKVFVTEREVSNRIVQLAQQRQVAPEKLKEDLEKNHELSALRSQLKEEKTIDLLIKKAKVEEKQDDAKGAGDSKKKK